MTTLSKRLAEATNYVQSGRYEDAERMFREVLQSDPCQPDAFNGLGMIAALVGKPDVALQLFEMAVQQRPTTPEFINNLGTTYRSLQRSSEAIQCYCRALELNPEYADVYSNLGIVLKDLGKLNEAVEMFRRAVQLKPDFANAHFNLANTLNDLKEQDGAVESYHRAIELKPDFANAYINMGNLLRGQGKLEKALTAYRRALEVNPDHAEAHCNVGNILKDQGDPRRAIESYQRAMELNPHNAQFHSNLLLALHHVESVSLSSMYDAHAEFNLRHAMPLKSSNIDDGSTKRSPTSSVAELEATSSTLEPTLVPKRRLRLGFVSPDLGCHPVGYFLVSAIEALSEANVDLVFYSDRHVKDSLTERFRQAATEWHETSGQSDEQLANQIRADKIDVLFDLAGHTAANRMLVFARKPAPISITWAGYVGTTGLEAIDYLLADHYEIPEGSERFYHERVLRMPDDYICYEPPVDSPPVSTLPAPSRGHITFGCFNNPAKLTPRVVEVWSRILQKVPNSQLILKYNGWNETSTSDRFRDLFAKGIDPAQIEFLGFSPHKELLAEYGRVDVALDPFPYSGGLTTCEAIWMGVPVITCPGETFASRHSLSHLSNAGLTETIAKDLNEYVEMAVRLANDLPRLAEIRSRLRPQMAASPLCDAQRFARNLLKILNSLVRAQTPSSVSYSA